MLLSAAVRMPGDDAKTTNLTTERRKDGVRSANKSRARARAVQEQARVAGVRSVSYERSFSRPFYMPLALTQTRRDVVVLRTTPPPTMRFLALHAHRTLPGRAPAPLAAFQDDTDYYALRFEGVERLYGPGTLANLAGSHVCVVGLGGVGSWAVEALARSGVGSLTLMDPDEVCISNTNRQTNALRGTVGRSKAKVLAEQLGRKRGPPRFGHSSAEQAAPAPERVPGADEGRPA